MSSLVRTPHRLSFVMSKAMSQDPFYMQAVCDAMSDDEFDKYFKKQERRATTRTQAAMSSRYPVWRSLLKKKLSKLVIRRDRRTLRRSWKRAAGKAVIDGIATPVDVDSSQSQ